MKIVFALMLVNINSYAATTCNILYVTLNEIDDVKNANNNKLIAAYLDQQCDSTKPYSVDQLISGVKTINSLGVRICCSKNATAEVVD